jgi:predicted NAD-dependent protein-ADP-ribosyltransferase YbiA (DUF1768 family)
MKFTSKKVPTTEHGYFMVTRKRVTCFDETFIPESVREEGFVYLTAIEYSNGSTLLCLLDDDDSETWIDSGKSFEFYAKVVSSMSIWHYEKGHVGDTCPVTGVKGWSHHDPENKKLF